MVKVNTMDEYSINVAVLGVGAFLPQAIDSVLAQSVSDWELILVDDGSPDRCGEICDQYAARDERIRVIHKENGGLVSARQAGSVKARGEYILNLDSDDYWNPEMLSNLKTIIHEYHPDGIFFGFQKVTEEGVPICDYYHQPEEGFYADEALQIIQNRMLYDPENPNLNSNIGRFFYSVWASVFRRTIYVPIQQMVPLQVRMGEDAAVSIPAMCKCKSVYFLKETLYNYRMRGTSITHTFLPSEIQEIKLLGEHLQKYANGLPHRNLGCYLYRRLDGYWVNAARNLPDYSRFRACVADSLKAISEDSFEQISGVRLKWNIRLRLLVEKNNLWPVFWLVYHRNP